MMEKVFLFLMITVFFGANSVLAASCVEVGRKVANQENGVLMRSTPVVKDGRDMCVIVVVSPAREDKKLRRIEVTVPAN
ncbi:hypothetical protein [Bartonella machadoae]|uniref:hypothetical protein n=1 Tax=Bartonella machadoae TaxID=2893471 RepID=UPI001F4D216A|nr:hypothetical protein [Bartonella machadoae]UNE54910.1 hypothetical protein LNM86_03380 [Bartonella machadoae]